jgi:hypothetical protein
MVHFNLEVVEARPTTLMHHFRISLGSCGDICVNHAVADSTLCWPTQMCARKLWRNCIEIQGLLV